eukprot:TRINITY_DN43185_c0_g1_i1.p1 TRINITY_DN43185_c0_g1~~TRINITY_DN43185_c0_g1_i1.p1  ORF type:complete len:888 (+),score=324.00 TRINITY_DN43185_c0_g1_i1:67-2664(+)
MASIADDWQGMETNGQTMYYRRRVCYEMRWRVNLEESLVAVGSCGGPVAVTRDPGMLVKDTTGAKQNRIAIYKSSGQFIHHIETPGEQVIHSMAWTQDELLAVVFTESLVHLYSLTGELAGGGSYKGTAARTSFYGSGVLVLTDKNVMKNVSFDITRKPQEVASVTPFAENLLSNLTQAPTYFHAFVQNSGGDEMDYDDEPTNVACLLSPAPADNQSQTLFLLTEKEKVDLQTGQQLSQVLSVTMSPNTRYTASFNALGKINVSQDLRRNISNFNTRSNEEPNQLLWCGSDAVVAIWLPHQLQKENSLVVLVDPSGAHENYTYQGPIFAVTERDCIRIISNTTCDIIEKVPRSTAAIFTIGSLEHSALLLDAFNDYENEQTKSIQSIRQLEAEGLRTAVETLIDSAGHEWCTDRQKELLKAASYGKCFCKSYNAEHFLDQCKKLRVLNAVRAPDVGIPLTLPQYNYLTPRILINRLINRQQYLLAHRIASYLDLKEMKEEVLVQWGKAKIIASKRETAGAATDDDVVRSIQEKFSETPGIYRKVAATAYSEGKKPLAIKLLEKEAKASDQVDLLIEMNEKELALKKAVNSGDTDLVYLVMLRMKRNYSEDELIRILSANTGARDLFVAYCEHQNPALLDKYFSHMRLHHLSAFRALKRYVEDTSADIHQKDRYLKEAKEKFGADKERKLECKLVDDQRKLLLKQRSYEQEKKDASFTSPGLSVTGTLRLLIKSGDTKEEEKICSEFKVSNDMYHWTKLRALAEFKRWDALVNFAETKRSAIKKSIGFHPFVQECLKVGNKLEARKYVTHIEDYAQRCESYCALDMFKEAVDCAKAEGDPAILEAIRTRTNDPSILQQIDSALQRM